MIKQLITIGSMVLAFFFVLCITGTQPGYALHPPSPGEIEKYKQDGSFPERFDRVKKIGNHKANPYLMNMANQKIERLYSKALGRPSSPDRLNTQLPPGWKGSLPTIGSPRIPVFLVDFPDYPHTPDQTVEDVQLKMFGEGDPALYPYESLRKYYQRSSYGKLNLDGTVLGWYRARYNRGNYESDYGQTQLIKEVFTYHNSAGHDFSQYDNNNDGVLDSFFIKWTGPDTGWGGYWWAFQSNFTDPNFNVDGKKLNYYVFSWYANENYDDFTDYTPQTDIHETGHLLGLPDYYDYDPGYGTEGGVGGLDMMDSNWGDHNCFSKFALGWINPLVIASGEHNLTLYPSGSNPDAVLIMPDAQSTPFGWEFFMAQYRKRSNGNDPGNEVQWPNRSYPADGMLIWHVDTTLDADGETKYNNSDSAHKLLKLMEADGLNEIEQYQYEAEAGDFYNAPKTFAPNTWPNSNDYYGRDTKVIIDQLTSPEVTMGANFKINNISGDINMDGRVSIADLSVLARSYGNSTSDLAYDLAPNGFIDLYDMVSLSRLISAN